MKRAVQMAVVYCVRNGRLLVFRHTDLPPEESGLQVPRGAIGGGEDPAAAALRPIREATGKRGFEIEDYLGRASYDLAPYRHEVEERFFFLARATDTMDDRWIGGEIREGKRTRFEFFWIPLVNGHVLQAGQGALLGALPEEAER